MAERGNVKINIQRGASVGEFVSLLADLEEAYVTLYLLPIERFGRRFRLPLSFLIEYIGIDLFGLHHDEWRKRKGVEIYPEDQLQIDRISIQSPGWIDLIGSLNPLQQLREYLKDRHERKKDLDWRGDTERERAELENEILRQQVAKEATGVIREFNELLREMDISSEERQRIIWERLGPPLMRLGRHQDTGLLGSQNDSIDRRKR